MYDDNWELCKGRGGKDRVPRQPASKPPCQRCPKGPVPFERELSAKNWQAWEFYLQCKAGRPIPGDPIVHRNHALMRWVEDSNERANLASIRSLAQVLRVVGLKQR